MNKREDLEEAIRLYKDQTIWKHMTTKELADYLGVHVKTIRTWVKAGKIKEMNLNQSELNDFVSNKQRQLEIKELAKTPGVQESTIKALKSINTPKSVSARRSIEINSVISKREN